MAPFAIGLINLKPGTNECDSLCEDLYSKLSAHGIDVLYDDTEERAGSKFATMDLIGLPWQVVVGPRGAAGDMVELKDRKTGSKEELSREEFLALADRFIA